MLKYVAKEVGMWMNTLVLAYLGDAVYELYVREFLIDEGLCKVKDLQNSAIGYVSADAQSKKLDYLLDNNLLTNDEVDLVKRGRNAHGHKNKSTDINTYKRSTGLEALIGYLYLNDKKRLDEVMKVVLSI